MKTKLLLVLILLCNILQAQWKQLGVTQFSNSAKDADIAVNENTGDVFVGYIDTSDNNFIKVMRYDNGSWVDYGATATSVGTDLFTLEINPVTNEPWIFYKVGNGFRVIRYDGTNWVNEYINLNTITSFAPVGKLQMKFDSFGKATIASSTSTTGNGFLILYSNITGSWSNALSTLSVKSGRGVPILVSATLLKSLYTETSSTGTFYDVQYHSFNGNSWSRLINAVFQSVSSLGNLTGLVSYSSAVSNRLFIRPTDIISAPSGSSVSIVSTNSLPYVVDYSLSNFNNENYLFYVDNTSKVKLKEGLSFDFDDPNIDLSSATNKFTNVSHNNNNGLIYVVYNDSEKCSVKLYERQRLTYYVDTNATGNNNGTNWADAYTNLQDALINANSTDQIWIASGTYKPDVSDRDISFQFNANIYGGFNGTETDISDRDMSSIHTTNETILSGDLLGDDDATVDFNDITRDDNSKHVVEVLSNNLIIDGITVQDGNADATLGDDRFGGGIFKALVVNDLTLRNTVVKNNIAFTGGGLSLTTTASSNINIDACIIENNLANGAAGIDFHLSGVNASMNMNITNSLFKDNKTADDTAKNRTGFGGSAGRFRAFFSGVSLNLTFVNNTLVNNQSTGSVTTSYFPVLDISKNSGYFDDIIIANNIFWDNTANTNSIANAIGTSSNSNGINNASNSANIIVDYNIDEDGLSQVNSTNTFITDPGLDTDFKLTNGSYAIDTGRNTYLPSSIITDLENKQRIFNTTVDFGAYEFIMSTLSITDVFNDSTFIVYPNPTSVFLNIKMNFAFEKAEIFNLQGQKILESSSDRIDVSKLPDNIYLLKIKSITGKIVTKRIIKN